MTEEALIIDPGNLPRGPHPFFQHLEVAVQEVNSQLLSIYNGSLANNFFQGGWAEDPNYPDADYQKYTAWILGQASEIPFQDDMSKVVLIGSNKFWKVLDCLTSQLYSALAKRVSNRNAVEQLCRGLDFIERAELICPGGLTLRLRNKGWDRFVVNTYDYKMLHIDDPHRGYDIAIRAVSTEKIGRIKTDSGVLALTEENLPSILTNLKQVHQAISDNAAAYKPTLFFDANNFEKLFGRRPQGL